MVLGLVSQSFFEESGRQVQIIYSTTNEIFRHPPANARDKRPGAAFPAMAAKTGQAFVQPCHECFAEAVGPIWRNFNA